MLKTIEVSLAERTTCPLSLMTPEIQRLLETTIDSFEKLEIVRCLWKRDTAPWSTERLGERVGTAADHIATSLDELTDAGIVRATVRGREYVASKGGAHDARIEQLLALYEEDPLAIMRVINEIAVQRIRSMAARTFADSFLMRRPKKPEGDDG
ncbi:MAG: hypothetical protein K8M05_41035 [Deltaproteobacteria bacterium]|nr:hypothetical protein [Kofleriaceae bacterium]